VAQASEHSRVDNLSTGQGCSRLSRLTGALPQATPQLPFSLPRGMLTQETQGGLTTFIWVCRSNIPKGWMKAPAGEPNKKAPYCCFRSNPPVVAGGRSMS